MREVESLKNKELYIELRNILRIANQAAVQAKLENKKFGIPKIFSRNEIIYFEFENGEITTKRPDILKVEKRA